MLFSNLPEQISALYEKILTQEHNIPITEVRGRLVKAAGLTLEAVGCALQTGQRCLIQSRFGEMIDA